MVAPVTRAVPNEEKVEVVSLGRWYNGNNLDLKKPNLHVQDTLMSEFVKGIEDIWVFFFFSVKDRNLFHRVDTIGNIFTRGAATSENITDGVHEMK